MTLNAMGIQNILLDSGRFDGKKLGESLPPSVRNVLSSLDILSTVEKNSHESHGFRYFSFPPSTGLNYRSAWGTSELAYNDFILSPHGKGWHLDRENFDKDLREQAKRGID
jgi:hypothetical protein